LDLVILLLIMIIYISQTELDFIGSSLLITKSKCQLRV